MKIAFDLDGTITRHPDLMTKMAMGFIRAGIDVFVLTAAAGELAPEQRPAEVRKRLDAIGWRGVPAVCVESSEKPAYCKANSVDVLIDDTDFKMDGTLLLLVK